MFYRHVYHTLKIHMLIWATHATTKNILFFSTKEQRLITNQLTSFFVNKQKKHSQEISKTKQIRENVRTLQRKLEISRMQFVNPWLVNLKHETKLRKCIAWFNCSFHQHAAVRRCKHLPLYLLYIAYTLLVALNLFYFSIFVSFSFLTKMRIFVIRNIIDM